MIIHTENASIDTNKAGLSFLKGSLGIYAGIGDGETIIWTGKDPSIVDKAWTNFQKLLIDYRFIYRNFEIEDDGSFTDLGMCGEGVIST